MKPNLSPKQNMKIVSFRQTLIEQTDRHLQFAFLVVLSELKILYTSNSLEDEKYLARIKV